MLIYNYHAVFTARDIVMEPSYDGAPHAPASECWLPSACIAQIWVQSCRSDRAVCMVL